MENQNKEPEKKESFFSFISVFLVAIVLALIIRSFIFSSNLVIGESMYPTFEENDRLISLIFPLYFSDPKRGDIVIIDAPEEEGKEYIKRIVGVPEDEIEIKDGYIYINGDLYEEDYIKGVPTGIYNTDHWTLNEDEYFVVGDNREPNKSMDSRYFGPIEKDTVKSIVKFRFWPIKKIGFVGGLNVK